MMPGAKLMLSALLALSGAAGAEERMSAQASREKQTSTLEQVSTKPLLLFSMRGRLDPFMAYALLTTTASVEHFSIANLTYSGIVQVQDESVALFRDTQGRTYTLKGAYLHGPENQRMAGIRGRLTPAKEVSLEQGEKRIVYSTSSTSKRLQDARSR
jgi:hypothetical protein